MSPTATTTHTASAIDDLPQIWGGMAKLVREGLGLSAFGVQIIDFPPDYIAREHDETHTGQEELYIALSGSGSVEIDGEDNRLDADHVIAVAPATPRIVKSGPAGLRVLCIGGAPGQPYKIQDWSTGEEAG